MRLQAAWARSAAGLTRSAARRPLAQRTRELEMRGGEGRGESDGTAEETLAFRGVATEEARGPAQQCALADQRICPVGRELQRPVDLAPQVAEPGKAREAETRALHLPSKVAEEGEVSGRVGRIGFDALLGEHDSVSQDLRLRGATR